MRARVRACGRGRVARARGAWHARHGAGARARWGRRMIKDLRRGIEGRMQRIGERMEEGEEGGEDEEGEEEGEEGGEEEGEDEVPSRGWQGYMIKDLRLIAFNYLRWPREREGRG